MGKSRIEISAEDHASGKLDDVTDKAESVSGLEAQVDVGISDNATQTIDSVKDHVNGLDGESADAEIGVDDNASAIVDSAKDKIESIEGTSGTGEIGVDDNSSPIVDAAKDKVEGFGGVSGDAEIGANDEASAIIDSVRDKAASWAGSAWNATIGVVDAATAPIDAIISAVNDPLTQAGAALGITVGLNDTIDTYKSFESMMSQVQAISGATGSDLEALTAKAKEMGATTKFTATESAEAMNYMAMAGWKTSDMISGISGIMNLAAASGESLGSTSDIVTDALTAFGLKAGDSTHFADVLAQASANANTNVGMLGESFKYVAPVAGAMNYSVEDTSLALGLMANASVKGSMAGTALKTALANMASPTDNMTAAMEKYGISLTDSEGNMKSLGDVLWNLRSSLGDLSETEQTAAASTIFGKEAMAGMLAIINASEEDYNKLSNAIYNADGAAQRMSDTMLDNVEGSLTLMQSAVDGVKNSFGERLAPYIRGVADMITEATPGAETALIGLMDFVDGKAAGIKRSIDKMKKSAEWKEAGLTGKINIAWDKIIAEPFLQWAGGDGKALISEGLGNLFSEAGKIIPGGEEAGLTSWLSAGLIAKGTVTAVEGIGGLISKLSEFSPVAGKFGIASAAVATAVAAIGVAIDNYNQKQISSSLEDHFGNISLSAKEAEEVASGILKADYLVNVNVALGEIENADQMRTDAEKALEATEKLTWKSSIGIVLTPDEQQEYTDNITTFVDSKIAELESRTFAAHLTVQTILGGSEEGVKLADSIEGWARADHLELTELSNDLKKAVEDALSDGIMGVDEAQAISELQDKINSITNRWKQAEAQAQMDWISQNYGNLSGKELESGSFESVVEALKGQREAAAESTKEMALSYNEMVRAAEAAGRLGPGNGLLTADEYIALGAQAVRNQQGIDIANSLDFESNTLEDAYRAKLSDNIARSRADAQRQLNDTGLEQSLEAGESWKIANMLSEGGNLWNGGNGKGLFGVENDRDQAALNEIYETMKPDVSAMGDLIDQYRTQGQAIPRALMDSYNRAVEIGAASGDADAAWQSYANQLLDSGNEELINAITDQSNPLYEGIRNQLPAELTEAIDRAAAETTPDPMTLEGLTTEINGESINIDKDEWVQNLKERLEAAGNELEAVTETELTVKVNSGDTLSEIAEQIGGITWQELAEYNGIENPDLILSGMEIRVPREAVNVDTSEIQSVIEEETQALGDDGEPIEKTAEVSIKAENTDTSQAVARAEEDTKTAFEEPLETPGSANVTLTQTNNVDAIYSEVNGQVQGTFAAGYSTTADVAVTLNWHITNPSASIGVSSSGMTATASIAGYANGGFVDEPTFLAGEDGPEFVIPVGAKRRNRGLDLWAQAGEALGAFSGLDIPEYADGGFVGDTMPGYASEAATAAGRDYSAESEDYSKYLSESGSQGIQGAGPVSVPININLSPTFEVSGGKNQDDDAIVEIIRKHLAEMTDEIGDNFAELLEMVFGNMPLAGGT